MKRFTVGYLNFFDNDLTLELVEAKTEQEARWKHSKLQSADYNQCQEDTQHMDSEAFKHWCFDADMIVDVIEIP